MKRTLSVRSFDRNELTALSAEYSYAKPSPDIKPHGFLTKEEFLLVTSWKTSRQAKRCMSNDSDFVEEVTKTSFSAKSERLRIESLRLLSGVDYPVASTLLHFGLDCESYPIIDFRAIWSLYDMKKTAIKYDYEFWTQYRNDCLTLSKKHGLTIRELDKALWQYSKVHQKE